MVHKKAQITVKGYKMFRPIKVTTTKGEVKLVSREMKEALKKGIERRLIPRSEYTKPLLKLDESSKTEILKTNNYIYNLKSKLKKLEKEWEKIGDSSSEKINLQEKIEYVLFQIFESKLKIRNIKINRYKEQLAQLGK